MTAINPLIARPTELVDFLTYLEHCAPDFPEEDKFTNATAFGEAFAAFELFANSALTPEGREADLQCKRHLQVAYEYFENGDDFTGSRTVQGVDELFRKARRFITISDAWGHQRSPNETVNLTRSRWCFKVLAC